MISDIKVSMFSKSNNAEEEAEVVEAGPHPVLLSQGGDTTGPGEAADEPPSLVCLLYTSDAADE